MRKENFVVGKRDQKFCGGRKRESPGKDFLK